MCDTLCVNGRDGTVFGKSSDRPFDERQLLTVQPRRPAGGRLRTQYIEIDDAPTNALIGSQPTWLWGFEHGVNEHRLAIGNETVWTTEDPHGLPPALIGMDLVRLGLERARSADEALDVITSLVEVHGQGGSAWENADMPYFSSFLLADPHSGWVIETSNRTWVARPVAGGTAISNRVSMSTDWTRSSADVADGTDFDTLRDPSAPTAFADLRLDATRAAVAQGAAQIGPREMAATLRHHGSRPWGAPGADPSEVSPPPESVAEDWTGVTVCMHVRDYIATTSSMICELPADSAAPLRLWIALGSPCVSVYVPVFFDAVPRELSDPLQWDRLRVLRDRVEADGSALAEVRSVLGPVEADLWEEADALAESGDPVALKAYAASAWAPIDSALTHLTP